MQQNMTVRLLQEPDINTAERIFRLAFGTFLGLPDPTLFSADKAYVSTRWRADPTSAFGAEVDGTLIGSNIASNWGSVGFFGPLTVHPDYWNQGMGQRLMEPILHCFERWGIQHAGLSTFPHSTRHIHLYQKFGFWPRFLTMLHSKPVQAVPEGQRWIAFSQLTEAERVQALQACREMTETVYPGLDLAREITSVHTQQLGETLLLTDDSIVRGIAVCHCGEGTEAGSQTCYIKFGAVCPGRRATEDFQHLLQACEAFAATRHMSRLEAGVNTARHNAYRLLQAQNYRPAITSVVMQQNNDPGYNHPDVYLLDDWR